MPTDSESTDSCSRFHREPPHHGDGAQIFASQKVCGLSELRTAEFEKHEVCATRSFRQLMNKRMNMTENYPPNLQEAALDLYQAC